VDLISETGRTWFNTKSKDCLPDKRLGLPRSITEWQILVKDGVQGEWIGDYKSAEDVLAALEEKVRNEFLGWK